MPGPGEPYEADAAQEARRLCHKFSALTGRTTSLAKFTGKQELILHAIDTSLGDLRVAKSWTQDDHAAYSRLLDKRQETIEQALESIGMQGEMVSEYRSLEDEMTAWTGSHEGGWRPNIQSCLSELANLREKIDATSSMRREFLMAQTAKTEEYRAEFREAYGAEPGGNPAPAVKPLLN